MSQSHKCRGHLFCCCMKLLTWLQGVMITPLQAAEQEPLAPPPLQRLLLHRRAKQPAVVIMGASLRGLVRCQISCHKTSATCCLHLQVHLEFEHLCLSPCAPYLKAFLSSCALQLGSVVSVKAHCVFSIQDETAVPAGHL